MIPISRDCFLKKTISGVTYLAAPPVGKTEIDVINAVSNDEYILQMHEKYYKKAEEDLRSKLVGLKKTNPKHQKLITEKIKEYIDSDKVSQYERDAECLDNFINIILVGWESKIHKLPEFKKGDCAADMPSSLKVALQGWYMEEFNPGAEEVKK